MSDVWIGPRALAEASGVSTDTLRHYERMGLLTGTTRTAAGYRRYPPATVDRVRLIRRALVVGFSLKDLASVLRQRDRGPAPCQRVRAVVGARLEALEQQLLELMAIRDELRIMLGEWDRRLADTPMGQRARLLDLLAGHPVLDVGAHVGRGSGRRLSAGERG
jgi:DNA-binding transcriptional MerR regulator